MKAELLDGSLQGEVFDIDEMSAELLIGAYSHSHHYHLRGINADLTLEYSNSLQSIVQSLLTINGQFKAGIDMLQITAREIELAINRSLLLVGRVIKILTGRSCGRTTHHELGKDKIFADQLQLVPCIGIVRGWFLPGDIEQVETHNISLLVQLESGSILLLETTKFHFLVGEIIEGKYAHIKQHQHLTL